MINSILNRHKKKIVIDCLFTNDNDEFNLVLDKKIIKEKVNDHFQNVAVSMNSPNPISGRQEEQYTPKDYINKSIYNNILASPTMEEWMKVVKALLNDKACGSSGIYNEYIKHLDDSTQKLLLKLIQMIFVVGEIPMDWKSAFIYPIPKSTEWHYNISKTRPITLLETVRKAYVKILTNCLSKILQKHNVLRGNNFAGLPGKSTDEPIKMINMLMEDVIEHNKELWILF